MSVSACSDDALRGDRAPTGGGGAGHGGGGLGAGGAALGGAGGEPTGGGGGTGGAGAPCGDCAAGIWSDASTCVYPSFDVDPDVGLPPADTGAREVFDPDDFPGADSAKLQAASQLAAAVQGAVVMHRVYETGVSVFAYPGVLYTGGGIRRACAPVATTTGASQAQDLCVQVDSMLSYEPGTILAVVTGPSYDELITQLNVDHLGAGCSNVVPIGADIPVGATLVPIHTLLKGTPTYTDDVIIDAVLLDGAFRCNPYTSAWTINNAVTLGGANTVRNSVIFDSPSESLTMCGGLVENNAAFALQGSLIHKSCVVSPEPLDLVIGNHVDGANAAGDEVMKHSEGLITLSANAGNIQSSDNVFFNGGEGVFGLAGPDDEDIYAVQDCYAHFDRVIRLYNGADQNLFEFDAVLIDVPTVFDTL